MENAEKCSGETVSCATPDVNLELIGNGSDPDPSLTLGLRRSDQTVLISVPPADKRS